jgi:hypothetical protein
MSKFAFRNSVDSVGRHVVDFESDDVEGHLIAHPPKNKNLNVVYMGAKPKGSSGEDQPNVIGPKHVRAMAEHLRNTYPNVKTVTTKRTSGARFAGMSDDEFEEAGGPSGTPVKFKLR